MAIENPALALLVYLDAIGVSVKPSADADRVALVGAAGPISTEVRLAVRNHERELRELAETIPAGGWPCAGGCGRRSFLAGEKAAYRCWSCGLRKEAIKDVVVTVPRDKWTDWLAEGDMPGGPAEYESHFWIPADRLPETAPGARVYIVAHGRVRGYAPLVRIERRCRLWPERACLMREGGAVAVTILETVKGFQGWRYRWWDRTAEAPFPDWQTAGVGSGRSRAVAVGQERMAL